METRFQVDGLGVLKRAEAVLEVFIVIDVKPPPPVSERFRRMVGKPADLATVVCEEFLEMLSSSAPTPYRTASDDDIGSSMSLRAASTRYATRNRSRRFPGRECVRR